MRNNKKRIFLFDLNIPYLLKDIDYPVGGAAVECTNWLWGFKEAGYNLSLLSWKGSIDYIDNTDISIIETFNMDKGIPKLRYILNRIPSLFRVLKKYKPDYLIQECAGVYTGILAVLSKILGITFIYRIASDIDVDERIKKNLSLHGYYLYKIGLYLTPIISCQNSYQTRKMKNQYPNKKIFKIYNPIKITNPRIINNRKQRTYFTWIGNLTYAKNMGALLDIANKNQDISFKIAGMETPRTNLETKIAIGKLRELSNVEFLGYVNRSNIEDLLCNAIALINTSWFEGFSNTFLEAWAVGTPVITTNNVNPDDIIRINEIGFAAENYADLAMCVRDLMSLDENEYFTIARKCQEYVMNNHNHKTLASNFLKEIVTTQV